MVRVTSSIPPPTQAADDGLSQIWNISENGPEHCVEFFIVNQVFYTNLYPSFIIVGSVQTYRAIASALSLLVLSNLLCYCFSPSPTASYTPIYCMSPSPTAGAHTPICDFDNSSTHYNDVIMSAMASQITSDSIVYSAVCLGADQRKDQSSASLAFVRRINRLPVNSPHKMPLTQKMFSFDDVIINQASLCGHSQPPPS